MKIYVGCSLTHAPEEFKTFISSFKGLLAQETQAEILEFIGLVAGTSADVYTADLGNVETCDAMIAFVNEPSIGLGMEIGKAVALEKPLLCLLEKGEKVTRMIHGAHDLGLLSLVEYQGPADALQKAKAFIAQSSG